MSWESLITVNQAPVVRKVDSAIHRITIQRMAWFAVFSYPLDSYLSGGYRYLAFEQPGPEAYVSVWTQYNQINTSNSSPQ